MTAVSAARSRQNFASQPRHAKHLLGRPASTARRCRNSAIKKDSRPVPLRRHPSPTKPLPAASCLAPPSRPQPRRAAPVLAVPDRPRPRPCPPCHPAPSQTPVARSFLLPCKPSPSAPARPTPCRATPSPSRPPPIISIPRRPPHRAPAQARPPPRLPRRRSLLQTPHPFEEN